MRQYLKDNNSKLIYFYMVDSTDHVTPKTGLTLTVRVSKNGAAFGAGGGSTPAELEEGVYAYTPGATDVDKLGPVVFKATASGADPCLVEGVVLAYDPYDTGDIAAIKVAVDALVVTVTGLSTFNPNTQTVKIRKNEGCNI